MRLQRERRNRPNAPPKPPHTSASNVPYRCLPVLEPRPLTHRSPGATMCRRKKEGIMPDMSGSFSGKARLQTAVSLADIIGHELQVAEIVGSQRSTDPNWNDAGLTYWGVTDIINGNGTQKGYYVNEHGNGERECGTFEGKVITAQGQTTLEGTWQAVTG